MRSFRGRYGAGPGHLALIGGCLLVGGYAGVCAWQQGHAIFIAGWLVVGLVLHDLIGYPLYSWADRLIQRLSGPDVRRRRVPWTNHVRVPLFMSSVLLVTAFPLIARLSARRYNRWAGVSESAYLYHWAAVTAALFAVSALLYALRSWRARAGSEV